MKVNAPGHGVVLAGMIAAMLLTGAAIFSAGSVTHGFVSYYAASRLLVGGELGPTAYDDRWFGEVVQRITASSVREIFIPNPPTMSLMALPLVRLDPQPARAVWLLASVVAFIAGIAALVRHRARQRDALSSPVLLLMMLAPAVFTNIRIGQGYLLVAGLFAAAVVSLLRGRDRVGGVCLGLRLALKTSGVALAVLLLARKRWTALRSAIVTAIGLAIAITPFIDAQMWFDYLLQVRAYVDRPASSVTAYQTTLGLVRHLCVADPQWNPTPAANCAGIAFVLPTLIVGAATMLTVFLGMRAARPEPWLAAAASLSVLSLPAVAEPHFVLMAIPLALLRLSMAETVLIGALLIVPMEWTAERFTTGWSSLLAYPRLYAAWGLWAISVRQMWTDRP